MMGLLDNVRQFANDVNTIARGYGGQPSPTPGNSGGSPSAKLSPFPINESVSVVLDGGGNGTARITPGQVARGRSGGVGAGRNSGLSWDLTAVNVSVSTFTNDASAVAYISYGIQSSSQADAVAQTASGSSGDTATLTAHLIPGDWLTVVWTGGDVGAVATMRLTGSVNPPGVTG